MAPFLSRPVVDVRGFCPLSRDCANFVARVVPLVFVFPGRFVHVRTKVTLRRALFWKILSYPRAGRSFLPGACVSTNVFNNLLCVSQQSFVTDVWGLDATFDVHYPTLCG